MSWTLVTVSLDATLNLLGLALSGALTGMLAGLLRWFSRPGSLAHYRLWTAAWLAQATYFLIGATSFALGMLAPPDPSVRFALSAATQIAGTLGCVLLVLGAVVYLGQGTPDRKLVRGVVVAAVVIGVAVAALAQFGDWRLLRQIYRSSSAAGAYLLSAALLWRARARLDRPGRVLAVALAGFGLSQLHLFVYLSLSLNGIALPYELEVFAILDLFWMVAIVATMAGMALADQRAAVSDALRRQEVQFRRMIEYSSDVVAVLSDTYVLRYLSPSAERILGWKDEPLGQSAMAYVHPDDLPAMEELARRRNSGATPFAFRFRGKDGNWRRLEGVATRVADETGQESVFVNARDLAERDRLEATLRESQKLESVGRLAGGVAHDFNNLLTVITGTAELARAGTGDGAMHQAFDDILGAAGRAADLTRALLSFARRQVTTPRVFDVDAAISRVVRMTARLLPASIDVRVESGPGRHFTRADPGLVEQVMVNLVVNARDAIVGHGRIEVRTGRLDVTPQVRHDAVPGPYVTIAVGDSGSGIRPEVRPYLFEPFFTTKVDGEGTGLGLATSYGIVRQAGGFITVDSEVGHGATFTVFLPEVPEAQAAVDRTPEIIASSQGELVLVVEDDANVRHITATTLRTAGYEVIEAFDGVDGLQRAAGRTPRVVVTDMVMPRMGGLELVRRLRAQQHDLGVLLVSGNPGEPDMLDALPRRTRFLQKPFRQAELATHVAALL